MMKRINCEFQHVILEEMNGGETYLIKKYIQAAIVILIGGAAYFFVLGKIDEPPVSRAHVEQLFHSFSETAEIGQFENYSTINQLTEKAIHIQYQITEMKRHQTMYSRYISKDHYYEDEEIAAYEKRYNEIKKTINLAVEQYLAPRINFEKVLAGEIDDPAITYEMSGSNYKIAINGQMKPSSTLAYWPLYYIDTANGSYFFKEPDYTSATLMDTQYAFRGNIDYTFNIAP